MRLMRIVSIVCALWSGSPNALAHGAGLTCMRISRQGSNLSSRRIYPHLALRTPEARMDAWFALSSAIRDEKHAT